MGKILKTSKREFILIIIIFLILPIWFNVPNYGGGPECNGTMTCELGQTLAWAPFGGLITTIGIFAGGNQVVESLTDYLIKIPSLFLAAYIIARLLSSIFRKKK